MTDRRTALGLGLAASAVALSGRGAARADALSIGPTGVNIDSLQVEKGLTVAGDAELKNSLTVVGDGRLGKSLTVTGDATLRNSLTVSGADGAKSLRVSPATAGANLLDVQSAARVSEANHPKGLALYVTADGSGADGLAEFRHSNGSQGIGIGYNTIYATGSNPNQDLILKARGTGRVKITGTLEAKDFAADANPLRNRMYPEAPIVYQDIFDALNAGAIQKFGNPTYDDTTYRGQSLWGERHIIRFGGNNEVDGNGALVTIPPGYDTVWVRVLGERWNVIHAYFTDGEDLGLWAGGWRSANSYAPDGTLADGWAAYHQWTPIPARRAGKLGLISKSNTDKDFWISGLAFSKNPWGHAAQSAVGYHWAVNGGSATGWSEPNWNSDSLAYIPSKTQLVLKVPVVPSGRDKLLYLIEHNSNWNGASHTAISVGGKPIEQFMATYDNPFSRHWNSKSYERYIATRIPKDHIPANVRHIDVIIDMAKQGGKDYNTINFREIGTHDLAVPWSDQAAQ